MSRQLWNRSKQPIVHQNFHQLGRTWCLCSNVFKRQPQWAGDVWGENERTHVRRYVKMCLKSCGGRRQGKQKKKHTTPHTHKQRGKSKGNTWKETFWGTHLEMWCWKELFHARGRIYLANGSPKAKHTKRGRRSPQGWLPTGNPYQSRWKCLRRSKQWRKTTSKEQQKEIIIYWPQPPAMPITSPTRLGQTVMCCKNKQSRDSVKMKEGS